jgi:hypothetical protein
MQDFWLNNTLLRYCPKVKGYGLFVRERIAANTCIREYAGKLVSAW